MGDLLAVQGLLARKSNTSRMSLRPVAAPPSKPRAYLGQDRRIGADAELGLRHRVKRENRVTNSSKIEHTVLAGQFEQRAVRNLVSVGSRAPWAQVGSRIAAPMSPKSGLFQPIQHMVAGLRGAKLPSEPLGAEKRRHAQHHGPLSLGVPNSVQQCIGGRQNRPPQELGVASKIAGKASVHGFDGLAVPVEEIIGYA